MRLTFKIKNATGKDIEDCEVYVCVTTSLEHGHGGYTPKDNKETFDIGTLKCKRGEHFFECYLDIDKRDYRQILSLCVSVTGTVDSKEYTLSFTRYDMDSMRYLPVKYTIVFTKHTYNEFCPELNYIDKCYEVDAPLDASRVWVIKKSKEDY